MKISPNDKRRKKSFCPFLTSGGVQKVLLALLYRLRRVINSIATTQHQPCIGRWRSNSRGRACQQLITLFRARQLGAYVVVGGLLLAYRRLVLLVRGKGTQRGTAAAAQVCHVFDVLRALGYVSLVSCRQPDRRCRRLLFVSVATATRHRIIDQQHSRCLSRCPKSIKSRYTPFNSQTKSYSSTAL